MWRWCRRWIILTLEALRSDNQRSQQRNFSDPDSLWLLSLLGGRKEGNVCHQARLRRDHRWQGPCAVGQCREPCPSDIRVHGSIVSLYMRKWVCAKHTESSDIWLWISMQSRYLYSEGVYVCPCVCARACRVHRPRLWHSRYTTYALGSHLGVIYISLKDRLKRKRKEGTWWATGGRVARKEEGGGRKR